MNRATIAKLKQQAQVVLDATYNSTLATPLSVLTVPIGAVTPILPKTGAMVVFLSTYTDD